MQRKATTITNELLKDGIEECCARNWSVIFFSDRIRGKCCKATDLRGKQVHMSTVQMPEQVGDIRWSHIFLSSSPQSISRFRDKINNFKKTNKGCRTSKMKMERTVHYSLEKIIFVIRLPRTRHTTVI